MHKNLVFVLAFVLALSSFGSDAALVWVHTDGSVCYSCAAAEPVRPLADTCCAPVTPIVSSGDCQICCEAEGYDKPQQQILPLVSWAVLPKFRTGAKRVESQARVLSTQQCSSKPTALHSPPPLRGPPICGRLT